MSCSPSTYGKVHTVCAQLKGKRQTVSAELPCSNIDGKVQTVSAQLRGKRHTVCAILPWSQYVRLAAVESKEARDFYEAEAVRGGWSVRQLDRQISTQFYERTALSRDKATQYKLQLPDENRIREEFQRVRRELKGKK